MNLFINKSNEDINDNDDQLSSSANKAWNLLAEIGQKINNTLKIFPVNPNDEELSNLDVNKEDSIDSAEFYDTTQIAEICLSSDSEDSDEEIYTNLSTMEKCTELRASTRSRKSLADTAGIPNGSDKNKHHGHLPTISKVAIARVMLLYNVDTKEFKITVIQIYDLVRGSSNSNVTGSVSSAPSPSALLLDLPRQPYFQVHTTLLPDKKNRLKTKSRQGPDPVFNETFVLHNILLETLEQELLRLRLYVSLNNSSFSIVGQSIIKLATIDLQEESEYNFTLTEYTPDMDSSEEAIPNLDYEGSSLASTDVDSQKPDPELSIGLSYNSKTGRLTVELIQGVNLTGGKSKEFYSKLSLFSSIGKELSHTKSSVRKGGSSPVFRESFIFQIAQFQLKEVTLMVSVFAKKTIHRKEMIGWLAFGYKSSGTEEANHWNDVREAGDSQQVFRCHKLQQNAASAKSLLK